MEPYHVIADAIAADIAAGRLRPGDRLPPQRHFARRRGIAPSTAARVYAELVRRGLVVGEVGRGTYVRAAEPPLEPALTEPGGARVDLEMNFPVLADQSARLAASLSGLLRGDALAASLAPVGVAGTGAARLATATLLTRAAWTPDPDRVVFAGNGRQAIAAAIAALVPVGSRLGIESLTYPVIKGIAARLGVTLVPLAMDESGLVPDALRAAPPLRAVYVQPTLHNPLGVTMPEARRAELAATLRALDLPAIEDTIYGFLRPDVPPLAALAPEHVVVADSLSKRLAPGLSLGFLVPPAGLANRVGSAVRSGGWAAQRFALEAATRWMSDGTARAIESAKREDASARQRILRERLGEFDVQADQGAYHCWWRLPEPWRAETFVAAAARHGIAVSPAAAFTVGPGHAPSAVRLALSAPPHAVLSSALATLGALARGPAGESGVE